eukprot:945256-Amphidinium_carterae.1
MKEESKRKQEEAKAQAAGEPDRSEEVPEVPAERDANGNWIRLEHVDTQQKGKHRSNAMTSLKGRVMSGYTCLLHSATHKAQCFGSEMPAGRGRWRAAQKPADKGSAAVASEPRSVEPALLVAVVGGGLS